MNMLTPWIHCMLTTKKPKFASEMMTFWASVVFFILHFIPAHTNLNRNISQKWKLHDSIKLKKETVFPFFSSYPCSNKLSTSTIQSFTDGVLLSIVDALCKKFNLSHVMQKIQTLPLSLTIEAIGAVGSYKHIQACTFNIS